MQLRGVLVAFLVKVCVQAPIIVDLRGGFVAGEIGRVKLVRVRLVVLLGGGVLDREGIGLVAVADGNTLHGL